MDCPVCGTEFDELVRVPRILTVCGHTVCQLCVQGLWSDQTIQCPQCHKASTAAAIELLPVNFALMQLRTREGSDELCSKHNKQLEAYCSTDKSVLCVSCILEDDHKKHDITSIQKAASRERDRLNSLMGTAQQTESSLVKLDTDLQQATALLNSDYERTREEFQFLFNQLKSVIVERENTVMERLKQTLESEGTANRQREFQHKKHMYLVQTLKNEIMKGTRESDLEVVRKIQDRDAVVKAATAKVQGLPGNKAFGMFSKEVELNGLWKVIKVLGAKTASGSKPAGNAPPPSAPQASIPTFKKSQPPLALANSVFSKDLRKSSKFPDTSFTDIKSTDKFQAKPRSQTVKITVPNAENKGQSPEKPAKPEHSESFAEDSVGRSWMESELALSSRSIDLASLCRPPAALIFAIGGFSDSGLLSVERYDCLKDEWTFVSSSLTNRTQFGSVILEGRIVAFGGKTAGKRVANSEEYAVEEDRWMEGRVRLQTPRSGFACVAISTDLYVVGGTDGVPLKKTDMWNGEDWTSLAPMRYRRDELAAVLGPDLQIYAIGGYGGTDM